MDKFSSESTLQVQGFTPYAQIPRWILRAGDKLSHGSVRLYGVIMTYADNDTKTAFPGREKLAGDLGIKARSVSTYIKELEEFGALEVTRRRNKRTGNFYANHYVLVFSEPSAEYCTPQSAADYPITTPTISTTPTGCTSEETPEKVLHPRSVDQGPKRGANADPISPGFYASEDRATLLSNVQGIAKASNAQKELAVDQFAHNLTVAFNEDDVLDHLIWDRNWQPPKKCADRFEAAVWLNTFLNKWRAEVGGLSWRGE